MGFWLGLALAAAQASADPSSHTAVITEPNWEQLPSANDFERYFPIGANSTGKAVIRCFVQVSGKLRDCIVVSEDPPDQGFGAAALKMAPRFKMRPRTRDGQPVDGGEVMIPISFGFVGLTPPTWAHPPTEEQLKAVWPARARNDSGLVGLDCEITITGRARDCHVASEAPSNKGFGEAALKLVPVLALKPGLNGKSPTDVRATLPIVFQAAGPRQAGVGSYGDSLTGMNNAPWKTAPGAAEMAAAWPQRAPTGLAQGQAVLRCGFTGNGGLESCSVEAEEPAGSGFGAAALKLAGRFRVEGPDPQMLSQARLNLAFTFVNPASGPAAPAWITKANWVRFIAADTLVSLYPKAAASAGVTTGRGVVECTIAAGGALTACRAVEEDPAGLGFGDAAVAVAAYFVLNPWTDDGRPVDGAKLRLPIRFVEAEPAPPAPAKPGGG